MRRNNMRRRPSLAAENNSRNNRSEFDIPAIFRHNGPVNFLEVAPIQPLALIYNREGRVAEPERSKLVKHLMSTNVLYNKPNCVLLSQMVVMFAGALFFISMMCSQSMNFWFVLIIFGLSILMEFLLLAFLWITKHSVFKLIQFLPVTTKLIELIIVISDYFNKDTKNSVFASFLLAIPLLMIFAKKSNYFQLETMPTCMIIVAAMIELMLLIKVFTQARLTFYSILIILFYFFLVTFFFHVMNFVTSVLMFFQGIMNCFKNFKWKVMAVQFFLGMDNIVAALVALVFANWCYSVESLNGYTNRANEEKEKHYAPPTAPDIEREEFMRAWAVRLSIITLLYVIVRNICLYLSTYDSGSIEVRLTLGTVGVRHRLEVNQQNRGQPTAPAPKVSKPTSGATSFLNLFRINANYYGSLNDNKILPVVANSEGCSVAQKEKKEESEEMCTICVCNQSNCIILNCKHGGICKQCALAMLTKSSHCPFCRETILKVCVVNKVSDTKYEILEEIKL